MRSVQWRSDDQVLRHRADMALLVAVRDGRVVRGDGAGGDGSLFAPHLLDGQPVRLSLVRLAREDLIEMPISGPPRLAARGRRLLNQLDQ